MQPKVAKPGPPTTQLWCAVSRFLRWKERSSSSEASSSNSSSSSSDALIDLEAEYQKACRTDSYEEFAKRVQLLLVQAQTSSGSSSTQLPSFELLADGLLEPNADKVLAALLANKDMENKPELFKLVNDHFDQSARASSLCSMLLKGIEKTRDRCRNMKAVLLQLDTATSSSNNFNNVLKLVQELLNTLGQEEANPFSTAAMQDFEPVYHDYAAMQTRLDGLRKKTACKLGVARRCLSSCTFLSSAACVVVLVITMAVLLLAAGALFLGWRAFTVPVHYVVRKLSRGRRQRWERAEKQWRQSEAVAQGTFMVVQDLDTMKPLVMRLANEVEFARRTVEFCAGHHENQVMVSAQLEQLNKNQAVLSQLLDELEENVYLCFLSINRARALVVRELCLH